jgi:hypothetical protein
MVAQGHSRVLRVVIVSAGSRALPACPSAWLWWSAATPQTGPGQGHRPEPWGILPQPLDADFCALPACLSRLENSFVVPDAALADVPAALLAPADPALRAAGQGGEQAEPRERP